MTHIVIRWGLVTRSRLKPCSCTTYLHCFLLSTNGFLLSPGALPVGQNNPQKNKYELYAEGVSMARARGLSVEFTILVHSLMALRSLCQGNTTSERTCLGISS